MRIVRFKANNRYYFGEQNGELIYALATSYLRDVKTAKATGEVFSLEQVELLAPCVPTKALCLGLNYRDHAEEFHFEIPKWPIVFMKPATALLNPGADILYPNDLSRRLDYEGEFTVVIGAVCKDISREEAEAHLDRYVLGYTCGNDVTARDLQPKNGQWTIAKSFDTFMPLGPAIETDLDYGNLDIKTIHNGKVVQHSNTKNLIFDIPYIVSYLSNIMTLFPGDVIMTGTSSGVGPMLVGDEITVEIEGIGRLTNKVAFKHPEKGYKPRKEKKETKTE